MTRTPAFILACACAGLAGCSGGLNPDAPAVPTGPKWAVVGDTTDWTTQARDPEAEGLCYRLDWGDGDTSAWTEPVTSGTAVTISHCWQTSGNHSVRAQARDIRENVSEWSAAQTVHVLPRPGYPGRVIERITVGSEVGGLAVSPDGCYLYVGIRRGDNESLKVFNTSDHSLVASLPCGGQSILVHPDGDRIYAQNSGGFSTIRTSDWSIRRTVGIAIETHDIALSPDARYLYACGYSFDDLVAVVSTENDSILGKRRIDHAAIQLAVSADGARLFTVGGEMSGNFIAVYRTGDFAKLRLVATGYSPYHLALTPDGQDLYVANLNDQTVCSYSTRDYQMTSFFYLDDIMPTSVAIHPAGRFVYVTGDGACTYVIDRDASRVMTELAGVGGYYSWYGIAFLPDGSRAYITTGNTSVVVLGF